MRQRIMNYQLCIGVRKVLKRTRKRDYSISGGCHCRSSWCDLARKEGRNGRFDISAKHFLIAANLGHDNSIQALKKCYKHGFVSKEDFAASLRAHQAAVDAAKSPQRDAADAFLKELCAYQQTTSGGNT